MEKGPLSYQLTEAPGCLHLKNGDSINGRIDTVAGIYMVSARVTDALGNTDQQTFQVLAEDTLFSSLSVKRPLMESTAYPNPFSSATMIEFDLEKDMTVSAEISSLSGVIVASLLKNASMVHGRHSIFWDGTDGAGKRMPNGTYLCRIIGNSQQTVILKIVKV